MKKGKEEGVRPLDVRGLSKRRRSLPGEMWSQDRGLGGNFFFPTCAKQNGVSMG